MKQGIIIFLILLSIFLPSSCEDSVILVDCDKCYSLDLSSNKYSLEIKVTIDDENTAVPITLYRGDSDNGEIISEDTINSTPYYTDNLEFDNRYSAIAKYSHNGRVIFAVDGKMLKKKYEKSSCDNPCYIIQGDVLDLRLK
jgi:hypothetical protein